MKLTGLGVKIAGLGFGDEMIEALTPKMLKGTSWETSLAIGILFSILVAGQFFLPNPYMPAFVRRAHQLEIVSSNFIFGVLLAGILLWRPSHASV